jgi:hypothetical protein
MVDPRLGTLVLSLLLILYAATALRRRPSSDVPAELGGAPAMVELEIHDRESRRSYRTPRAVLIGRSPSAAVKLDDPTVSRVHARIERRDASVFVEDLGSRNGTLVNGKPIAREALLVPGDRVRIGSTDIIFVGTGEWK